MISFLQINLGGGYTALSMALTEARDSGANVLSVSEPPPCRGGIPGWYLSADGTMVLVFTPPPNIPSSIFAGDELA